MLRICLAAALAVGLATAGRAEAVPAVGSTLERVLAVDGKQIALPDGKWVLAADAASDWSNSGVGAYGYMHDLLLVRLAGERVDAVLEVNTNALPTADGWGMAANCGRTDILMAVVRYRAGWDGSCFFVTHTLTPQKAGSKAWQQALALAAERRWQVPHVWLTAGFRAANRSDVIDARFHFAPETRGIAPEAATRWSASAWMAPRLPSDPQRLAMARAVSDWALGYSGLVEAGLKNRLPTEVAVPMPSKGGTVSGEDVLKRHTEQLGALRRAGAISQPEYEAQLKALQESGLGSSSTTPDLATVTAVKALSYRVIVSISHIFVDYYWTGNYVAAGALEILQITINSTKFYFHELAWARWVGLPRNDAARTLDFQYVGVDV